MSAAITLSNKPSMRRGIQRRNTVSLFIMATITLCLVLMIVGGAYSYSVDETHPDHQENDKATQSAPDPWDRQYYLASLLIISNVAGYLAPPDALMPVRGTWYQPTLDNSNPLRASASFLSDQIASPKIWRTSQRSAT